MVGDVTEAFAQLPGRLLYRANRSIAAPHGSFPMAETSRPHRSPAACTIIARNYLSYARILASSYLQHHPDGRFYVLVVDGLPEGVALGGNGIGLIGPEELGIPGFFDLCFKYDVTELCTAVKPSLLSHLIGRYGEEIVVYFDPDILILRRLVELEAALESANIVLIPHLHQPIPLDGRRPSEQAILVTGAYNLGFIALKKSGEVDAFLHWWQERLQHLCRIDPATRPLRGPALGQPRPVCSLRRSCCVTRPTMSPTGIFTPCRSSDERRSFSPMDGRWPFSTSAGSTRPEPASFPSIRIACGSRKVRLWRISWPSTPGYSDNTVTALVAPGLTGTASSMTARSSSPSAQHLP